jgi:hypothetical protein
MGLTVAQALFERVENHDFTPAIHRRSRIDLGEGTRGGVLGASLQTGLDLDRHRHALVQAANIAGSGLDAAEQDRRVGLAREIQVAIAHDLLLPALDGNSGLVNAAAQ